MASFQAPKSSSEPTLDYLQSMLAELRSISVESGEDFLTYLIEMAYREAKSLHNVAAGSSLQISCKQSVEQLTQMYMDGTLD